jgi:hypothetical protein
MSLIKRGTILHRYFNNTIPPKSKFFVVIGENENNIVGFFFVNTDINNYLKHNRLYFDMQMSVKRSVYGFLNYDSFIDAHELKLIDKTLLHNEITSGNTTFKGCLTRDDIELLLNALRESKLFSSIEKNTFFK